jgi:biotin carboxylase
MARRPSPRLLVLGAGPMRELFFHTAARLGVAVVLVDENTYNRYDRMCDVSLPWPAAGLEVSPAAGLLASSALGRHWRLDGPLTGVTALTDAGITQAAGLAAREALPGPGPVVARAGQDKAAIRTLTDGTSCRAIRARAIRGESDIRAFFGDGPRPAVLKPADGAGSSSIHLVDGQEAACGYLAEVLASSASRQAILEDYLPGDEHSIEVVVRDGRRLRCVLTRKVTSGPPHYVELQHVVTSDQRACARTGAEGLADRLIGALGVADCVLHVEAKRTTAGWALIEIAFRPAGGMICELVRRACGIDLYEEQIRAALGLPAGTTAGRGRHAGVRFVAGTGRLADIGTLRPVIEPFPSIEHADVFFEHGFVIDEVTANWRRAGYVLGTATRLGPLLDDLAGAAATMADALGLTCVGPATQHGDARTNGMPGMRDHAERHRG